jgi:uncharacterized protein YukE
MPTFQVTPEELPRAAGVIARSIAELGATQAALVSSAAAADGTPAAGSYDALLADAKTAVSTLQTSVEALARALTQASANYQSTESGVASRFTPAGRW